MLRRTFLRLLGLGAGVAVVPPLPSAGFVPDAVVYAGPLTAGAITPVAFDVNAAFFHEFEVTIHELAATPSPWTERFTLIGETEA